MTTSNNTLTLNINEVLTKVFELCDRKFTEEIQVMYEVTVMQMTIESLLKKVQIDERIPLFKKINESNDPEASLAVLREKFEFDVIETAYKEAASKLLDMVFSDLSETISPEKKKLVSSFLETIYQAGQEPPQQNS